jgi:cob(I)alamin adenosyltransferase
MASMSKEAATYLHDNRVRLALGRRQVEREGVNQHINARASLIAYMNQLSLLDVLFITCTSASLAKGALSWH